MTDNFKYTNVTYSSMTELLDKLKDQQNIEDLCKEYSLNIALLKNLFILSAKGYNNVELAQKLGIHRVTVQRYSKTLKSMKYDEYISIFNYITQGCDSNEV